MLDLAGTVADFERAGQNTASAAHGLTGYFRTVVPGLCHELDLEDDGFSCGPSQASSIYYVVGAIDMLRKMVSVHLTNVLYSRPPDRFQLTPYMMDIHDRY